MDSCIGAVLCLLFRFRGLMQGGAKYPPYFQWGIVKEEEAVEGWDWAQKVQVVGKFPLQHPQS